MMMDWSVTSKGNEEMGSWGSLESFCSPTRRSPPLNAYIILSYDNIIILSRNKHSYISKDTKNLWLFELLSLSYKFKSTHKHSQVMQD
jgi:hypothetical protein